MLVPLRKGELERIIPAVATSNQFAAALGDPRKILQRLMISSIGGVITLLISQSQVTSQFYSLWLILGVVFILYTIMTPLFKFNNGINWNAMGLVYSIFFFFQKLLRTSLIAMV